MGPELPATDKHVLQPRNVGAGWQLQGGAPLWTGTEMEATEVANLVKKMLGRSGGSSLVLGPLPYQVRE